MSYRQRLVLAFGALGAAGLAASAAHADPPRERPAIVGTYQRVAKDMEQPDGTLVDVYEDVLVTGTKAYHLTLPRGTKLVAGTPVRVHGRLAGADLTAEDVQAVGEPAAVAASGTTKVLVILAYWTSPDSVTTAQAKSQIFGDDDGWFGEASYGQLGLTGTATPWVQITGPTGGLCYANHMEIMDRAQIKAKAIGYDSALYDRTIVYFPRCGGDAAGAAGWAYQPGNTVWLNGYMDRRVSVHEQGHNYGLPHAHSYTCSSGGVRITLGTDCYFTEYGDDYDAMGGSNYAAHYSAPQKDQLGWLAGKKRTLTSAPTTFTLPPFETAGAQPLAAVSGTTVSTRKYWVEYRQASGYDGTLPLGATGGVLVHLKDTALPGGDGPFLIDPSPQNAFADAVIPPGGAWTSPEGVRISVGAVSATGASVTVEGGVAPPVAPSVPLNVAAVGGDGEVRVSWDPPASNGGATVQSYVVHVMPGNDDVSVAAPAGTATVYGLANGTTYTVTVAAANAAGSGPASTGVTAIPNAQLPSVALTAPAGGATVGGVVTLTANATPHPVGQSPVQLVSFEVNGQEVDSDSTAPYSVTWDSQWYEDGPYTLTATAYDSSYRYATSAPVEVTLATPKPTVTITLPTNNTTTALDLLTLHASAAPAANGGAPVQYVSYELADGTPIGYGGSVAPFEAQWDATALNGGYDVVAKVFDENGRSGTSAPVHVTFQHPVPSVALTAPADGASVQGSAVAVSASATPSAVSGAAITQVEFFVDNTASIGTDYDAPYAVPWDTGSLVGEHTVTAVATDADSRTARSDGRTVTVANPVPSVVITSPTDYAVVGGLVTFTAAATPNPDSHSPIDHVSFTVDGWNALPDDSTSPYTASWDSAYQYGQHTVVATAWDNAGRRGDSATVAFTVPYPAPTAVFTGPADAATLLTGSTVNLSVTAAPDVNTQTPIEWVEFYVDGEYVGFDDVAAGSAYSVPWQAAAGTHVLSAVVYDSDFYSGAPAPISVTVAAKPGAPTAVTAVAGTDGAATVSWSPPASDGGSPVTGYVVKTGATTRVVGSSPYLFDGLANGTSYTFSVAATNALGTGTYSALTPAVVPGTKTSLTVAASATTVAYGKSVTVSGTLKRVTDNAVLAGRTVQLLACTPGTSTCTAVKSGTTGSTGKVSIAYAPTRNRDLRLRYVRTTDAYLGVTSAAKLVKVSVLVSSAISRTTMALGGTATVSGRVTPAHSGKRVYLQRLTSTGWKSLTYKNQSSTGYVAFSVKPTGRGTWTYRLYFPADTDHAGAYSASRAVKVS